MRDKTGKHGLLCSTGGGGNPQFFSPPRFRNFLSSLVPIGEVMGHAGTAQENFDMVVAFAASIRMIPVKVLKEQPGYLLNSMLVPLLVSAEQLWANGVGDVEDIDRAWRIGTGSPKGPFQILDIIVLFISCSLPS